MRWRISRLVLPCAAFALGAVTMFAAAKAKVDVTALFAGDPKAVSERLLTEARRLAGSGSWERIAVGRVDYLGGDKAKGQALFDEVLHDEPEVSDLYRIATAYALAGDWAKAKPLFDRATALKPGNDGGLVESACWHKLNGEPERAAELFKSAFEKNPGDFWNHVVAAGCYRGQKPF